MRALTLRQPYATLVALGAKRVETRSWSTAYRGRLLIHAGKATPQWGALGGYGVATDERGPFLATPRVGVVTGERQRMPLPLGALVASADLIDVLPMVAGDDVANDVHGCRTGLVGFVWIGSDEGPRVYRWNGSQYEQQLSSFPPEPEFGVYERGRWAWLLDDVRSTTERCPRCWGDGSDPESWEDPGTGEPPMPTWGCETCGGGARRGAGVCEPVPMRGRQGLWTPRPEDWPAAP